MITSPGCSNNAPCACHVGLPVVIESSLLLAHSCVSLTLRLNPQHSVQSAMKLLITGRRILLCMFWIFTCGYTTWGAYWILLCCPKLTTGLMSLGPLQRVSDTGQCHMLFVTGYLFRAISNPKLVTLPARPGCMWEGLSCAPRSAFPRALRQIKQRLKVLRDQLLPCRQIVCLRL